MEILPGRVLRVIGPLGPERQSAGVIISTDEKTFMIYVGLPEAQAILRELEHEEVKRPMTHDLLVQALAGFGAKITKVVISSLVDNTYFATIFMERVPPDEDLDQTLKEEVMLDARASDSIVLALKSQVTLEISRQVVDEALDIREQLPGQGIQEALEEFKKALGEGEEGDDSEGGWLPPQDYDPEKDRE